ncbi:formyl transferase [Colwellia hornerae]|uniref:Formyl transferase n=2 Tax=Colwellia hornerae TaxID=89402 RepID=A0A5C6QKJ8_9GAMM|nr:formyl transferase [Colwellia hornerae]TWX59701.1 formyl transferase [Colwellia hornerae]TWX69429.1 formyl transferase [Colwellia hornerae]
MKILFLANKDLASNFALNKLLPKVCKNHEVHLWLSAKVGKISVLPTPLKTLKFFEQDLFNQLLSPLIPRNKSNNNTYRNFDGFSVFLKSAILDVNQINSPEMINDLKALAPELIVSIRFGGILKEAVINIPTKGIINLHSGILPKYKGVMATFWAMKNNDDKIGTTLHTIDDGSIDTGQIIKTSTVLVNREKSYLWHVLELYKQGAIDILAAIETLENDELLCSQPQEKSDSYFTFPSENECLDFERSGFKITDEQEYIEFIQQHYL